MNFEGREQQIILEQRDQLMQLREENRKLRASGEASYTIDELRLFSRQFDRRSDGKTVGLQLPDDVRERLLVVKDEMHAKTYRQAVQVCIMLGLQAVEGALNAKGTVEEIQTVQRPSNQGDSTVRAASGC